MYDFQKEELKLAEEKAEKEKAARIRRGRNILTYFGVLNLIGVVITYLPYLIISFNFIFTAGLTPIIRIIIRASIEITLSIALIKGVTVVRMIYAILSFLIIIPDIFNIPTIFFASTFMGIIFIAAIIYSFFRGWQLAFNKNVQAYCRTRQGKF